MQLSVTGKERDAGDALGRRVGTNLAVSVTEYFDGAVERNIVFSRAAHLFRAEIAVRARSDMPVRGRGEAVDACPAFAMAPDHTAKPLRRRDRRMKNLPEQD
jgi:ribosome-associated translation inhibitor RaiA